MRLYYGRSGTWEPSLLEYYLFRFTTYGYKSKIKVQSASGPRRSIRKAIIMMANSVVVTHGVAVVVGHRGLVEGRGEPSL